MDGFWKTMLVLGLAFSLGSLASTAAGEDYSYDNHSDSEVQVQTRGPVHEAFAEPVDLTPEPGIVVSKAPPEAIEEVPPAERPADDSAIWIPGYWAWDDDSSDFMWISGIWRVPPPDYNWVPGYWTQTSQGYQWVAGFWQPVERQEIEYLPQPPETVETGPSSPQPSVDHVWVPGTWVYRQTRYAWRPGYWLTPRANWVWVPAHYYWTPRGFVFVEGYWDYTLERRGVLFAPVRFERRLIVQRSFRYTPTIVIQPDVLVTHLFVRPHYDHYYFGDYYATTYTKIGIRPWFEVRRVYNPTVVHYEWQHRRTNPHWVNDVRRDYVMRTERIELRPPRTYTTQRIVVQKAPVRERQTLVIGRPLDEMRSSKNFTIRLERVKPERRETIVRQNVEVRRFTNERAKWESQPRPQVQVQRDMRRPEVRVQPQRPEVRREVQTFKYTNPIITRRSKDIRDKDQLPPPRPTYPNVETRDRKNVGRPGPSVTIQPRLQGPTAQPKVIAPPAGQQPRTITPAPAPQVRTQQEGQRKVIIVPKGGTGPTSQPGQQRGHERDRDRKRG